MKRILSFAKKYHYVLAVALLAVFVLRAVFFDGLRGDDYIFAVKARQGFFSAVAYGAKYLGDGIFGSFLRASLTALPAFIWKAVDFLSVMLCAALAAVAASGERPWQGDADPCRLRPALLFSSVLFAVLPDLVLGEGAIGIGATVHCVIPCACVLLLYLLSLRAADLGRGAWYLPLISAVAALLSWQAAIAAALVSAYFVIRAARAKALRPSHVLSAAAPTVILAAHFVLGNIPRFPADASRLRAIRRFFAAVFDYGGFFAPLLILSILVAVRVFGDRVIGAIRSRSVRRPRFFFDLSLAVFAAAECVVLILRSPLIPSVELPGALTVAVTVIFVGLYLAELVLRLRAGDGAPLLFAVLSLAALLPTVYAYRFSGAAFMIALVLAYVVVTREFLEAKHLRTSTLIAGGVGALFAASFVLPGIKLIAAAGVILIAFVAQCSPLCRRLRLCETLAVFLAFLVLYAAGNEFASVAECREENARRIEAGRLADAKVVALTSPDACFHVRPDYAMNSEQAAAYRAYYGVPDDMRLLFTPR